MPMISNFQVYSPDARQVREVVAEVESLAPAYVSRPGQTGWVSVFPQAEYFAFESPAVVRLSLLLETTVMEWLNFENAILQGNLLDAGLLLDQYRSRDVRRYFLEQARTQNLPPPEGISSFPTGSGANIRRWFDFAPKGTRPDQLRKAFPNEEELVPDQPAEDLIRRIASIYRFPLATVGFQQISQSPGQYPGLELVE